MLGPRHLDSTALCPLATEASPSLYWCREFPCFAADPAYELKVPASLARPLLVPRHTQAEHALQRQGTPDFVSRVALNTSARLKIWDLGAEGHSWEQSAAKRKLRERKPSENPVGIQREVSLSAPDWPTGSALALGEGL